MKVLLTGAEGQLGRHLAPLLRPRLDLVASSRRGGDRPCDLADGAAVERMLDEIAPDLIVNCAAWTAVDEAEAQPEAAARLNHGLPAQLAEWCRAHDALLVHYSTDYVFQGLPGRAWRETDPPAPDSVYGQTKFDGEEAIRASGASALILRTAWLYSALPGNFLTAILARAGRGEALRVVSDQVGSPTWSGSVASVTMELLQSVGGHRMGALTLHVADRGNVSWHEFATLAVTLAAERGLIERPVPVEAITSDQWPQRARRPQWSVLDVGALESRLGHPVLTMRQALSACLNEWKT